MGQRVRNSPCSMLLALCSGAYSLPRVWGFSFFAARFSVSVFAGFFFSFLVATSLFLDIFSPSTARAVVSLMLRR